MLNVKQNCVFTVCFGSLCVFWVVVVLEAEPSARSEVLSSVEQVSLRTCSVFVLFSFPSTQLSLLKALRSMMLSPPCFTV